MFGGLGSSLTIKGNAIEGLAAHAAQTAQDGAPPLGEDRAVVEDEITWRDDRVR
jgi:hypothetical protein